VPGTRWIKVQATIVECFRAWEELPRNAYPWFEIVADIETSCGEVERVSARQKLHTRTRHWRSPDPGEVVPARWDPERRELRLALSGDLRYDEKLLRAIGRTREIPTWSPTDTGDFGA
jgi:ribosomal protein L39E